MLPIFDMSTRTGRDGFARRVEHLRASVSTSGDAARTVARIIQDVSENGDDAVVRYMRKWTDPKFTARRIAVDPGELAAALRSLDKNMRRVLEASIAHVRQYQTHILPREPKAVVIDGATLGLRFTPVQSVGLAVPGGKAAYPSSVIMLAVPAIVAGVDPEGISVVTPPPTRTDNAGAKTSGGVSPLVLATCALLGIRRVYRIGGAQAIAALAHGTKTVRAVDMIVGPGNVFTQLAKQQLAGRVGIDGFYGPSEIVTVADGSADPARVAADLIAQAEHDPGRCFLVAWSRAVIEGVKREVEKQTLSRKRRDTVARSLREWSAAVWVKNEAAAVEVVDTLAGEHVNLAVRDPEALLKKLEHGGEFFLGDQTPVAAGDYFAGPSHCLPTGTTARFASGVSVYTFLKRSGTVGYKKGMSRETIEAIAAFAEAEGLDGHAASARARNRRRI